MWTLSEFRGEEINAFAVGEFGKIEIVDTNNVRTLDFELDAEHRNVTYMTGFALVDRIIEIKVLKNEGVYREYVDYFANEVNIYNIENVTITIISTSEPWGYINYNESWLGIFIWVLLAAIFGVLYAGVIDSIERKHYNWNYARKEAQRREERQRAKDAKEDKKKE